MVFMVPHFTDPALSPDLLSPHHIVSSYSTFSPHFRDDPARLHFHAVERKLG